MVDRVARNCSKLLRPTRGSASVLAHKVSNPSVTSPGSRLEKWQQQAKLFLRSYFLTLGLWQHCHPPPVIQRVYQHPDVAILELDFKEELFKSLLALWAGHAALMHNQ